GIVHAEMFPLLDRSNNNPLELFQIWLNLPRANKFADPHFSMFWSNTVPRHRALSAAGKSTEVTVIAGRLGDAKPPAPPPRSWASHPEADVAIWTLKMEPGAHFTLPPAARGSNRTLYFFRGGKLRIGERVIPARQALELRADAEAHLENGPDEAEL